MKNIKGTLILVLTAFIWGMAFAAQSSAAGSIGAFTFNAVRSIIATVFLAAVAGIQTAIRRKKGRERVGDGKKTVIAGVICGSLLFIAVNLQQFGITVYPDGVASSGRSGFLTATYVVMVAFVSCFTGRKMSPFVILSAVGCLCGMYMLCLSGGISQLYLGDLLVFLCAVFFAVYIIIVDKYSGLDSTKVSCIQFLTCGILSAVGMFIFEDVQLSALTDAAIPILYAGIFSSGIGYTLQLVGQKYAEPAVASIAMSLESVFAALAGWMILDERLSGKELIGCGIVFASVILAQLPAFFKKEHRAEPTDPD